MSTANTSGTTVTHLALDVLGVILTQIGDNKAASESCETFNAVLNSQKTKLPTRTSDTIYQRIVSLGNKGDYVSLQQCFESNNLAQIGPAIEGLAEGGHTALLDHFLESIGEDDYMVDYSDAGLRGAARSLNVDLIYAFIEDGAANIGEAFYHLLIAKRRDVVSDIICTYNKVYFDLDEDYNEIYDYVEQAAKELGDDTLEWFYG